MFPTLEPSRHMYHQYDFDQLLDFTSMNNRLFCTFTTLADLDELIFGLSKKYVIMYDKMFVLHIKSNNEYVLPEIHANRVCALNHKTIELLKSIKDCLFLYL